MRSFTRLTATIGRQCRSDATSFVLMRRLGIRDALAFDGDFAAAGFVELRP